MICLCALLHFLWPAALQQCAAYAAATKSSGDVVLLTLCRRAAAVWSCAGRQLCVSNTPKIWVTVAPLLYCQIISPTSVIGCVITLTWMQLSE